MEIKNRNKGIIITLVAAIIITLSITAYVYVASLCNLDGVSVCVDKETGFFLIEEDANITVAVDSEAIGNRLVEVWNNTHPEYKGSLKFTVRDSLNLEALQSNFEEDVVSVNAENAAYFMNKFKDLGRRASGLLGETIPSLHQDSINAKGYMFTAKSVSGPLFIYNESLMESLGYDTTDSNNSGLPDAFETWENIILLADDLIQNPGTVFPLNFTDQTMFYPFLTGGRWSLNFTKNGSNPEFKSNEFLDGLSLIAAMGTVGWDNASAHELNDSIANPNVVSEDTNESSLVLAGEDGVIPPTESEIKLRNDASSLPWQYESAFFENRSLFSIALDHAIFDQYETSSQSKYVYAPFPMYDGHRLTPTVEVEGYMVNANTQFPSASAEAIRILRTPEMLLLLNRETQQIPSYNRNHIEDIQDFSEDVIDKIRAYSYSDALPVSALNNNPEVLSRSIYTEIDLMPTMIKLFNQELTPEQAQQEIIVLSDEWINKNDIIKED